MTNRKFRLTDESKIHEGTEVFRIEALQDIEANPYMSFGSGKIKAGQLGGFVESEDNLSFEEGDLSWISDNAVAKDTSKVEKGSVLYDDSVVKGSTILTNGSTAYGYSVIKDSTLNGSKAEYRSLYLDGVHMPEMEDLIVNSTLENTRLEDGSSAIDSYISGGTVDTASRINNSTLIDSYVSGSNVSNTHAVRSSLQVDTTINESKVNDSDVAVDLDNKFLNYDEDLTDKLTAEDVENLRKGPEYFSLNQRDNVQSDTLTLNDGDLEDLNDLGQGLEQ